MHDEMNYRQELNKSSDFSAKRATAFAALPEGGRGLREGRHEACPRTSTRRASTSSGSRPASGPCDLGMITEEKQPDWTQPPLIRAAILAPARRARREAPGQVRQRPVHQDERGQAAREVQLPEGRASRSSATTSRPPRRRRCSTTTRTWSPRSSWTRSWTAATRSATASRSACSSTSATPATSSASRGGFGRYLQNQNSMVLLVQLRPADGRLPRPVRGRRQARRSRSTSRSSRSRSRTRRSTRGRPQEFGWRYTPYAYILLKPRGPQVDKIPPLRIDLDFLDTSGYVVLPVESPAVPIDARRSSRRPAAGREARRHADARRAAGGQGRPDPGGQGGRRRAGARPGRPARHGRAGRVRGRRRPRTRGWRSRSSRRTRTRTRSSPSGRG